MVLLVGFDVKFPLFASSMALRSCVNRNKVDFFIKAKILFLSRFAIEMILPLLERLLQRASQF